MSVLLDFYTFLETLTLGLNLFVSLLLSSGEKKKGYLKFG